MELPDEIGNLVNLQRIYVLGGCIGSLPKSINQLCNLDILELSTSASLLGLIMLCGLEGVLNRSSLNISIEKNPVKSVLSECAEHNSEIERRNIKKYKNLQVENIDKYIYYRSGSLLECLRPLNQLVELKVNAIHGIVYPKWFEPNYNSRVAILMQFQLNNSLFFRDLGELPSLKSLVLICNTTADDFFQTLTTQDVKIIFPSLKELLYYCPVENIDKYIYYRSGSLLECLRPLNQLVELKVNAIHGIVYPKWFETNYNSRVAIIMQFQLNNGLFFWDLGELPSLKSLVLICNTPANDFFQTLTTQDVKIIFPSLKELLYYCPVLHSLRINNCPNLGSFPEFDSLQRLELIKCSFSKLEFKLLPLQLLQSLHIEECIYLTSLQGLKSLHSLRTLYVVRCPWLMVFSYPMARDLPISINIVECPSLKSWCQRKHLNYIEDSSFKRSWD